MYKKFTRHFKQNTLLLSLISFKYVKNKIIKATIMEKFSELLPVFGFVLSLGLFGYGLKKILIKVENDTSKD